jgi:hypothetical protein
LRTIGGIKMGKVISLKSREQLGGCDSKENDELVNKEGEYIGVLTPAHTKLFRDMMSTLDQELIRINQLTEEHDEHYHQYINELNYVFTRYKYVIKSYNPETERLFIGEDGHMWIIKKEAVI